MAKQTILRLVDLISGAASRTTAEHTAFLDFLETLIVASTPEVSKSFGKLQVTVLKEDGTQATPFIELTPADYLYWRTAILERGDRFKEGVAEVKIDIFDHLAKLSNVHQMTPQERAEFVALIKAERPL